MDPHYVMDEAMIWELEYAIRGYRRRQYELFSKLQNIAALQILTMPFSKKHTINPDTAMDLSYYRKLFSEESSSSSEENSFENKPITMEEIKAKIEAEKHSIVGQTINAKLLSKSKNA